MRGIYIGRIFSLRRVVLYFFSLPLSSFNLHPLLICFFVYSLTTPYTFHILLFLQSGRLNAPFRSCLPCAHKKNRGLSLTCVDETHAFPSSASYSSPWSTRLFLSSGILPILLSFRHRSASSSYLLLRTLLAVNRLWARGPRLGIWAGTPPLSTLPNSPIDPLGGVDADRGRCTISCCHGRQLYPVFHAPCAQLLMRHSESQSLCGRACLPDLQGLPAVMAFFTSASSRWD